MSAPTSNGTDSMRQELSLISLRVIASSPYNSLKGEKFVPVKIIDPSAAWQIGDVFLYAYEDYANCSLHGSIGLRVIN